MLGLGDLTTLNRGFTCNHISFMIIRKPFFFFFPLKWSLKAFLSKHCTISPHLCIKWYKHGNRVLTVFTKEKNLNLKSKPPVYIYLSELSKCVLKTCISLYMSFSFFNQKMQNLNKYRTPVNDLHAEVFIGKYIITCSLLWNPWKKIRWLMGWINVKKQV